jgi:hypothetical protein
VLEVGRQLLTRGPTTYRPSPTAPPETGRSITAMTAAMTHQVAETLAMRPRAADTRLFAVCQRDRVSSVHRRLRCPTAASNGADGCHTDQHQGIGRRLGNGVRETLEVGHDDPPVEALQFA